MDAKEWKPATVLDVFGDPLCRKILILASEAPMSAPTLADELDVTPPTVYRRTEELTDYGLVSERRRVETDGHHYRVYETSLRRVEFEIADGEYEVDVERRRDLTGTFESFWSGLEEASSDEHLGSSEQVEDSGRHTDTPS